MTIYRNMYFLARGLSDFTQGGYEKASRGFTKDALNVDCSDKVAIVTGANAGLGKEIAFQIAQRGASVYIICRNKQKGEEAQREIIEATKNEKVFLKLVDLSSLKEVDRFVNEFKLESNRLDILINNAVVMNEKFQETPEGLEVGFATNSLSPFYLTEKFLDLMEISRPARVINVASGGMYVEKLEARDLELRKREYDGTISYAQHKRQQVVFTEMMAKKYQDKGISFYTCHPGWADTPGVRTSMPKFYENLKDRLRTVQEGADTIVWLAVAKEVDSKVKSGDFIQDRASVSKHLPLARTHQTPEEEQLLWNNMEAFVKKALSNDVPSSTTSQA